MNEATTSRGRLPLPDIWREWGRFVRHPVLPERRGPFDRRAALAVLWLFLLNVACSLPLAFVLTGMAERAGIETPTFDTLTERGVVFTLLIGALAVPVLEEVVARGWLDGRRVRLVLAACVIGALASVAAARLAGLEPALLSAILLAWIVVAVMLARQAGGGVPDWFARRFPVLFFASAALFSLAHLTNYDLARPLILLPFVVPQFIAALIFGFARVRFGMWANISLHALSNALFLSLALSGV